MGKVETLMQQAQDLLEALRNFCQVASRTLDESEHAMLHIPLVGGEFHIKVTSLSHQPERVQEVAEEEESLAAKESKPKKRK